MVNFPKKGVKWVLFVSRAVAGGSVSRCLARAAPSLALRVPKRAAHMDVGGKRVLPLLK